MSLVHPVLIAGAGPVGLVAAAALVRAGTPVQVLEAGPGIFEDMRGEADEALLDRYDRQRRGVTEEVVQRQTIQNKKKLEAVTPEDQADFQFRMAHAAG